MDMEYHALIGLRHDEREGHRAVPTSDWYWELDSGAPPQDTLIDIRDQWIDLDDDVEMLYRGPTAVWLGCDHPEVDANKVYACNVIAEIPAEHARILRYYDGLLGRMREEAEESRGRQLQATGKE